MYVYSHSAVSESGHHREAELVCANESVQRSSEGGIKVKILELSTVILHMFYCTGVFEMCKTFNLRFNHSGQIVWLGMASEKLSAVGIYLQCTLVGT